MLKLKYEKYDLDRHYTRWTCRWRYRQSDRPRQWFWALECGAQCGRVTRWNLGRQVGRRLHIITFVMKTAPGLGPFYLKCVITLNNYSYGNG